jgi:hypothetical protein
LIARWLRRLGELVLNQEIVVDRESIVALAQAAWAEEEKYLSRLPFQDSDRLGLQRAVFIMAWVLGYEAALEQKTTS